MRSNYICFHTWPPVLKQSLAMYIYHTYCEHLAVQTDFVSVYMSHIRIRNRSVNCTHTYYVYYVCIHLNTYVTHDNVNVLRLRKNVKLEFP